jgi:hypothetical protein
MVEPEGTALPQLEQETVPPLPAEAAMLYTLMKFAVTLLFPFMVREQLPPEQSPDQWLKE